MAWYNGEACGRQRKYIKGSCLMGETFGCPVSYVSIRHDTLVVISYSVSDDMFIVVEMLHHGGLLDLQSILLLKPQVLVMEGCRWWAWLAGRG